MNTAQTIKTIIKAVINQTTDLDELESILEVLYEVANELDMELYSDEDDNEELEFEGTEFPKLNKPAAPFGLKKLPKDYNIK